MKGAARRQREEWAKRIARCVCTSADVIVYEDLKVKNLLKNHKLAKSISDIGWYQLRKWLEYFGVKFQKITIAVPPHFTSINCSNCGEKVEKTLSTRTHECPSCQTILDRDINAAINILKKGLSTTGHVGTWVQDTLNASARGNLYFYKSNFVGASFLCELRIPRFSAAQFGGNLRMKGAVRSWEVSSQRKTHKRAARDRWECQ